MQICIIGAMKSEIAYLKNYMSEVNTINYKHLEIYEGKINNHQIILTSSGIGKVSSGVIIGLLVSKYPNIDKIINIGVCGGINFNGVIAGINYSYADVFVPNYQYGQIPGFEPFFEGDKQLIDIIKNDVNTGLIITGDKFYTSAPEVNFLVEKIFNNYTVLGIDMESTAFAQSCSLFNIPFLAIRAVSDVVGSSNQSESYENNLEESCRKASQIVLKILEELK